MVFISNSFSYLSNTKMSIMPTSGSFETSVRIRWWKFRDDFTYCESGYLEQKNNKIYKILTNVSPRKNIFYVPTFTKPSSTLSISSYNFLVLLVSKSDLSWSSNQKRKVIHNNSRIWAIHISLNFFERLNIYYTYLAT